MWRSPSGHEIGRVVDEERGKNLRINLFVQEGDERLPRSYINGTRLNDDAIQRIVEVIQTPTMVTERL